MSKDQVNAFFEKVEVDKSLQDELKALEFETDEESSSKSLYQLVKIAKNSGFDFSIESYLSVINERAPIEALSDSANKEDDGCYVTWGCSSSHPLWSQPEPPQENPCDYGNSHSYIPGGYQPGDEDNV